MVDLKEYTMRNAKLQKDGGLFVLEVKKLYFRFFVKIFIYLNNYAQF